MRRLSISVSALAMAAVVAVCGCSVSSAHSAGSPPGDHGKLLQEPCWIQATDNGEGDAVVVKVAVPAGQKVSCAKLAGDVRAQLPGYDNMAPGVKVSVTSPLTASQLSDGPVCRGSLPTSTGLFAHSYPATMFYFTNYANGSDAFLTDMQRLAC